MSRPLERLAERVADDPAFLASSLALFARSQAMNDEQLADHLGCPRDRLAELKLCRAPRPAGAAFRDDVQEIAAHFALSADRLGAAVRRGQALLTLRRHQPGGFLMAARDAEEDAP